MINIINIKVTEELHNELYDLNTLDKAKHIINLGDIEIWQSIGLNADDVEILESHIHNERTEIELNVECVTPRFKGLYIKYKG